ncbi:MAG: hypothetical protein JXR31_14330 [Prolixibacteraceae bacterium]|nr:hypothetical protein [Prolixibacteraceae bacterium]MBN2775428.1 hypothetical protein [Prolixibacteraceae bacterium]
MGTIIKYIKAIVLLSLFFTGCRKSDFVIEGEAKFLSDDGSGIGSITLTKENEYVLEGFVFVNDGQVLTIEAGTVIWFKTGQAENASALIVSRGGKIIANGTREEPIIFTVEGDDLEGSVPKETSGLWGGLIILGNAPINAEGGEASIEGIPLAEPRGIYGGVDEDDNSGTLKYVSIRHGGTNIGEGNEINGLTLGGVGSGTEIDYVEVISNEDDGVEIFGGTVNLKHLVVSGCDDDVFDYDLGWTGNGQFWLGVQSDFLGDNIIEAGGGVDPVDASPYSLPNIFNITLIGNSYNGGGNAALFENNAGGTIANSVIINKTKGVSLEVTDQSHDSYRQWKIGNLNIRNNVFYHVGTSTAQSIFELKGVHTVEMKNEWVNYFNTAGNEISNPLIDFNSGIYIPESKIKGNLFDFPLSWFQVVDFKGAFGEDNWIDGWTLLSE